jgi:uncharacterized OB-fold protein
MNEAEGVQGFLCSKCGWSDFEAKTCPQCHSAMNKASFSRSGKIVSFTVIRYPPTGFEEEAPYVVGIVALENGPRVIGRIKGDLEQLKMDEVVQYMGTSKGALWFRI